jgi:hypothetical protein
MPPAFWVIIGLVIFSSVIGAIAKALNNWQEQANARRIERERQERAERMMRNAERDRDERAERPRPQAQAQRTVPAETGKSGATVRPANSDMDRFLAEIERLRRKQSLNTDAPTSSSATPVAPVVQPVKPPDKPRPRVVAELADSAAASSAAAGFSTMPQAPTRAAPVAAQIEELPVAQVLRPSSSTGAPATKVTKLVGRARPAAKTNFGKNLTALLGSGQGVAMAVVLQEILGPPKSKKKD